MISSIEITGNFILARAAVSGFCGF